MTSKITDFLKTKQRDPGIEAVQSRKTRWLNALEGLYSSLDEWLRDAVLNGVITQPCRAEEWLREDRIGGYTAQRYDFSVGAVTISVIPKGTYVVGADGRADVVASTGRREILVLKDNEWSLVTTQEPRPRPLNEQSFLSLLQELLSV